MKKKRKRTKGSELLLPLQSLIAKDGRNKKVVHREFNAFYREMKATIDAHRGVKALEDLEVPLEKVNKTVGVLIHGVSFGRLYTKVSRPGRTGK
jgi:hypothetical protein